MMYFQILYWVMFMVRCAVSDDLYIFGQDVMIDEEKWTDRSPSKLTSGETDLTCLSLKPTNKDIINRFTSILPYFERIDNDREKVLFLDKMRHYIIAMANSEDALDREVAYYATVLIPLIFLQDYRDMWCLLERFYRAIRLFSLSHPNNKKASIRLLQNLKPVNQKVKAFLSELPLHEMPQIPTVAFTDSPSQRTDIRYLKELFKNLG